MARPIYRRTVKFGDKGEACTISVIPHVGSPKVFICTLSDEGAQVCIEMTKTEAFNLHHAIKCAVGRLIVWENRSDG